MTKEKIHSETFKAKFEGLSYQGPVQTALVSNIRCPGRAFTQEFLRFDFETRFHSLNLKPGDEIGFEAPVTDSLKGYAHHQEEYEWILGAPTNLWQV